MDVPQKLEALRKLIRGLGSAVVAFSGGVDSTFLLRICRDELGERVLAVTAESETYPARELLEARRLADSMAARHLVIQTKELEIEGFSHNPPDRCYFCKRELFGRLRAVADREGLAHVLDGSNADDTKDYRPGSRAACELGVRSPLKEAGLTKADIRQLSRGLGLSTWDKPSYACLSSRFPYGEEITPEKVATVGRAEEVLLALGFKGIRVRHHGTISRIELSPDDLGRAVQPETRRRIVAELKGLGFTYVTLDLEGYRSGSMNEVL